MSDGPQSDTGRWWLLGGALLGIVLAASGVGASSAEPAPESGVPPGAVALVDGVAITEADYRRALGAVAADHGPQDAAGRRRVLDRLIDEALLVRGGLALGLPQRDRRVRHALTAAVIALVVDGAEEAAGDPNETQLKAFYDANTYLFRLPGALHVRQHFFRIGADVDASRRRAESAAQRLTDMNAWPTVDADPDPGALPDGLVPPQKLREYFGRSVLERIQGLEVGAIAGPLRTAMGLHIVQVVARRPGALRPFGEVRKLVAREFLRRAGDEGLRRYLGRQRAGARVTVADERL